MAPRARLRTAFVAALALLAGAHSRTLQDALTAPAPEAGSIHAVLVAGSNGWGNYRHQADVAHAYQVLVRGGVPPENVVTIAYDDIAINPLNPYPGKIFNRPGGPDVYTGIAIDYARQEATARNFLGVLRGNASLVAKNEHATGRVLEAGPEDRAFVYYADHGAPGLVGMPSGPPLWADQLHAALRERGANYAAYGAPAAAVAAASEARVAASSVPQDGASAAATRPDLEPGTLVFYLEACESGSMFAGLLDPGLPVYATTAANGEESSWGTYCPTFSAPYQNGYLAITPTTDGELVLPSEKSGVANGTGNLTIATDAIAIPALYTCLGDLYSVAWMEDAEAASPDAETLEVQYSNVRNRTSNDGTYEQGSHVLRFNNGTIDRNVLDEFEGADDDGSRRDWGEYGGADEDAWAAAHLEALAAAEEDAIASAPPGADNATVLASVDLDAAARDAAARIQSQYAGFARNGDADLVPLRMAAARGHADARAALEAEQMRRRQAFTRVALVSAVSLKALLKREGLFESDLIRDVVLAANADTAGQGSQPGSASAFPSNVTLSAAAQTSLRTLARRAGDLVSAATRASLAGDDATAAADAAVGEALAALQAKLAEVEQREAALAARNGDATLAMASVDNAIATSALNSYSASSSLTLAALAIAATDPLPAAAPDAPLVEDWDCMRGAFESWAGVCAPELRQSDLGLARAFANLCNVGASAADVRAASQFLCGPNGMAAPGASTLETTPKMLVDVTVGSTVSLTGQRNRPDAYAEMVAAQTAVLIFGAAWAGDLLR